MTRGRGHVLFAAPGFELARLPEAPQGLLKTPRGFKVDCLLRDSRVQREKLEKWKEGRKEEKRKLFQSCLHRDTPFSLFCTVWPELDTLLIKNSSNLLLSIKIVSFLLLTCFSLFSLLSATRPPRTGPSHLNHI